MVYQKHDIDLLEVWQLLQKRWKVCLILWASIVLIGYLYARGRPITYTSRATILPVTSSQEGFGGGIKDQLGALGGVLGSMMDSGRTSSTKILLAVLQSRTLSELVVKKTGLLEKLAPMASVQKITKDPAHAELLQNDIASGTLAGKMKFKEIKDLPTISIEASFSDPALSFKVAAAYLEELQSFLNSSSMTMAKRNRMFIEERLAENNAELLRSGKELAEFYERNPISNARGSLDVRIDGVSSRTTQVSEPDPEKKTMVIKNVPPKVYYEHVASQKEVLRSINGLLATQREIARIDEVKEGLAFQIVDNPELPLHKNSQKIPLITLLAGFAGFLLVLTYAFVSEYISNLRRQISSDVTDDQKMRI